VLGFATSLGVLAALGYGADRWVFVLVVWAVLVFIPLRIAIEALQTVGVRMREAVADRVAADPRRYERPELIPILVRRLFARNVTMPRITTPAQARKAREAASAIMRRAGSAGGSAPALAGAMSATVAAVELEAVALSAAASGAAADDIQSRWEGARALGALAAMIQVLAAAYADRWGGLPSLPGLGDRPLRDYLESALDYCDEAALKVDALPWTEPLLGATSTAADADDVRTAWRAFVNAGTPPGHPPASGYPAAGRALEAFLETVLPAR
ncbi:MAG: hypothetical protein ACRDH5_02880, partial [bacterium]